MRIRRPFRRPPIRRTFDPTLSEMLERRVLFAAGELDPTFGGVDGIVAHPDAGRSNIAVASAAQEDGKVVVVGSRGINFEDNDFAVERFNANGTLDTTFGTGGRVYTDFAGGDDDAVDVAVLPGGKIVVVGTSQVFDPYGPPQVAVARYNPDGSLDTTFDGDGKSLQRVAFNGARAQSMDLLGEKLVVFATAFSAASGSSDFAVLRYNVNGSLDTTFDGDGVALVDLGADESAAAGAVRPDARVVIAGTSADNAVPSFEFVLVALNPDGSRYTAFGAGGVSRPGGTLRGDDLLALPDNKVVMSFSDRGDGFDRDVGLVRFTSGGAVDSTFGAGGRAAYDIEHDTPAGLVRQPDGKLVLGLVRSFGSSTTPDSLVARFTAAGAPDPSFGGDGLAEVNVAQHWSAVDTVVQLLSGDVVVAGTAGYGAGTDFVLAKLGNNGIPDNSFKSDNYPANPLGLSGSFQDVVVYPDGRILAAGYTKLPGRADNDIYLARFTPTGARDNSFGVNGVVRADFGLDFAERVALQSDGRIVISGNVLARFLPDGRLDTSFGGGDGFVAVTSDLNAGLDVQPDDRILVSSWRDNTVSRYTAAGVPDPSFGQGGTVNVGAQPVQGFRPMDVAWQPTTGKVIVGGHGEPRGFSSDWVVVRLNANGTVDPTFGDGGFAFDESDVDFGGRLAIRPGDGKIFMAGNEDDEDAALVSFAPDGSGGGDFRLPYYPAWSYDVAVAPDGKVVIVTSDESDPVTYDGDYSDIRVNRFNADGSVDALFYPLRTDVLGGFSDIPQGVAVAPDGDVIVVGQSAGSPYVLRYQGSGAPDPVHHYGDGNLVITGTGGADTLAMSNTTSTLTVTLNGVTRSFALASIDRITADLGAGNDTAQIDSTLPRTTVTGGAGDDTLRGGDGYQRLSGGDGDDTLLGGAGDDALFGDGGNDYFGAEPGGDSYNGGTGNDTVDYSSRTAPLRITVGDTNADDGEAGERDFVQELEIVKGGSGDDYIADASRVDLRNAFYGNGGNDTLAGGYGVDAHFGGAGDDTLLASDVLGDNWYDVSIDGDYFAGGAGADTIDYSLRMRRHGDLSVSLDGVANDGKRAARGFGQAEADNVEPDVEHILGGAGDDYLSGSAGNNRLVGNGGDDILSGGAGDDTLDGGLGGDWLRGGAGTDTADYSSRTERLRITIDGRFEDGAVGERDNVFVDVENVWGGGGNDWISGSPGHNLLEGRGGNDTITGGGGRDYLSGGSGDDEFDARDGITDTMLNGGPGNDDAFKDPSDPTDSVESAVEHAAPAVAGAPATPASSRRGRQVAVRSGYRT